MGPHTAAPGAACIAALTGVLCLGVPGARAGTFNIADGDVAALVSALEITNTNAQHDTINLAVNGTYTLTTVNNTFDGSNGLPRVVNDAGNSLTINGNGATIQRSTAPATPDFRLFNLAGQDITLNQLTLANGSADDTSGTDTGNGGAVFNESDGVVTIADCVFRDNFAGEDGGAFYHDFFAGGTFVITNSSFGTNAAGWSGGAVFGEQPGSIVRSTFTGNAANGTGTDRGGGAVFIEDDLTIQDCGFSGNRARDAGGAVFNEGFADLTVSNTLFEGNSATNGGAILNEADLLLIDCTVRGNTAGRNTGGGGGIYNVQNASVDIAGGTMEDNSAAGTGGAIHNFAGDFTIIGVAMTSNRAEFGGGAILNGDELHLYDVTFTGNRSTGAFEGGGAVLALSDTTTHIFDSRFHGNSGSLGGAFSGHGSALVHDCVFEGNSVRGSGGAVGNDGTLELLRCRFTGNRSFVSTGATGSGGGLYNAGS